MTETHTAKPSLLRRIRRALVDEFTPRPEPRPAPPRKELLEGREAVGIIRYAVSNDSPEGGPTDDDLVIHIDTSVDGQHLTLPRTVRSPLFGPSAGRRLTGEQVVVRHTTLDPTYDNDVLVVGWPAEVARELRPFRPEGPGTLSYRIWSVLASLSFMIGWGGIVFIVPTACLLIGMLFIGHDLFDGFPGWMNPAVLFPASVVAIPLGFWLYAACAYRREQAQARIEAVPS
ncbi:hypothetical protein [Microbacterium sp.]|uniref:hypothetical protein n=1 Tax=Microbacterium sp. TaxID=51671 RepID=UPI0033405B2B